MKVKLVAKTQKAEKTIVRIARVSSSRKKKDKNAEPGKLINYLISHKHWSPFEHAFLTIEIKTSRAICTQFLRHRSMYFQQFSQRYASSTKMEPMSMRMQAAKNRQSSEAEIFSLFFGDTVSAGEFDARGFTIKISENADVLAEAVDRKRFQYVALAEKMGNHLKQAVAIYEEAVELGIAKECARFILPETTQTTFHMTGPLRSWIHMFEVRDDEHAQLEAQLIAKACKKIFIKNFPIISKARGYV